MKASPKKNLSILVVDDDPGILRTLMLTLKTFGCRVTGAESGEAALRHLEGTAFDVLLTDMRMEGLSGVEVIQSARARYPDLLCVIMTAFASYENAVLAIKAGAYDYLPKPFTPDQLEHLLGKIETLVALRQENQRLQEKDAWDWFDGLTSAKSLALRQLVERLAPSDATVLLSGETGSGKTELARAIHRRSSRQSKPFVEVICTTLSENLFESEVFGHVRGAFTGAVRDRAGKFELADEGTLFLDEIGELSATAQVKLLRFLEDKVIERVGDNRPLHLDVRIIAATNRNLPDMIRQGTFREDLYYRLNVFECVVPPLRERPEDIAPLAAKLFFTASAKYGTSSLSRDVMQALLRHSWPGNVRELRNVMERVALLAAGREAVPEDLPPAILHPAAENTPPERLPTLRQLEQEHIRRVLGMGLSHEQAAELLGINTVTLWRKRKEFG